MNLETMKGLHDAALIGIDSEGCPLELTLKFRTEKNTKIELRLMGCDMFRVVDFSRQNIVSRAMLFNSEFQDVQGLKELISWTTSLSDASTYLSVEKIDEIVESIRLGKLKLIYLEPSCGAEFSAVCNGLKVLQYK